MSTPIAVANLLAEYLRTSPTVQMPGADGMLVDEVLVDYEALAAAGQVPTEAELCVRHPDLAAKLTAFFYLQHPQEGA